MKKLLSILMLFLPGISFAGTHVMEGSPFTVGQCLQAASSDTVTTSGAGCGVASGGSSSLEVMNGAVQVSSPTATINFSSSNFTGSFISPSTAQIVLNSTQTFSSITVTNQMIVAGTTYPTSAVPNKAYQMTFWNNGVPSFGDAPGFAMVDNTAFTLGASSFNPVGGVYNDTSTALGVGAAAGARITPFRALEVNLRDNAGVVIATGPAQPLYMAISSGSASVTTIRALNSQVVAADNGLVTNTVIHGLSSAGGGGYVDVKVNPSGTLEINANQGPAGTQAWPVTSTSTIVVQSTVGVVQVTSPWAGKITDATGVILGTSTANPIYTYTANPSTAAVNVTISSGTGPGGTVLTLSGRLQPQTVGVINSSFSAVTVFVSSYSNVTFMITPGTSTGITVNFESSIDSGTNYVANICNRVSTYNTESSFTLDTTTNTWTCSVIGSTNFRVRSSAWTNGISTVTIQVTGDPVSQSVSIGQPIASQLRASVNIDGSSNTVKVVQSTVGVVTTGIGLQVISTQTFTVQPIGVTTVTFNGSGQPVTSTNTVISASNTYNNTLTPAATGLTQLAADEQQRLMVGGAPTGQIKFSTMTISTTTETVLISSGAAGIYNDLCNCTFTNTSTTFVTVILRGAGNGGTIRKSIGVPGSDFRGFWPGCQNPYPQPIPAANWTVTLSGAVTDVELDCDYIPRKR